MFGLNSKSRSIAQVLCAAILASAIVAPAAMAHGHSGGNAFQIPSTASFAMYSAQQNFVGPVTPPIRYAHTPAVIQRSSSNPKCAGGANEMDRSEAGNGMGLMMTCR